MKTRSLAGAVLLSAFTYLPVAVGAPGALRAAAVPVTPCPQSTGTLESPVRIAANRSGLLVTDHRARKVIVLNPNSLAETNSFEIDGRPLGIGATNNRVYVGNQDRQVIEERDKSGAYLGDLPGTVAKPSDIAIDSGRRLLFVVDSEEKIVRIVPIGKVTYKTKFTSIIPVKGANLAMLSNPTAIAVDPTREEILVSDFGDSAMGYPPRVQIFSYSGALVATISGKASMMGNTFSRPQGLAFHNDHVFVVDSWVSRVFVYRRTTLFKVKELGTYGVAPGELSLPLDLVIDEATQDVFVTNNRNQRIEVFSQGGLVQ